jgi:hypothetical protein
VTARETKTAEELETMIMDKVRKHPDLRDVQSVLIEENLEPHPPNWKAGFVMDGSRNRPAKALQSRMKSLENLIGQEVRLVAQIRRTDHHPAARTTREKPRACHAERCGRVHHKVAQGRAHGNRVANCDGSVAPQGNLQVKLAHQV